MVRVSAQSVDNVEMDVVPQTLGVIFKTARANQKKSLELISEQLKIRKIFLQAIENEQFDVLPGGVYTVGFIRSYAKYLGLDHDAIIEQLKDESFFVPVQLPTVGDEEHFPSTRFISTNMVVVGLLFLLTCFLTYYLLTADTPVHIHWEGYVKHGAQL